MVGVKEQGQFFEEPVLVPENSLGVCQEDGQLRLETQALAPVGRHRCEWGAELQNGAGASVRGRGERARCAIES